MLSSASDPGGRIHVGTSGWAYPSWKPGFYPAKLPAKRFLEEYSRRLNSVEVNYTFRSLPSSQMLAGWLNAVGPEFRFSFKAPQRITHFSRLRNSADALDALVRALSPVRAAGRLGTILFQLPPNFRSDPRLLGDFLTAPALKGADAPLVAFEFRHESWFSEEVFGVLRQHNAALCVADGDDLQTPDVQCATTHACYRLRRTGGYSSGEIAQFASHFSELAKTRDVYVYLRHEEQPTGALNAVDLLHACAPGARN